jgi:hypothetical protein
MNCMELIDRLRRRLGHPVFCSIAVLALIAYRAESFATQGKTVTPPPTAPSPGSGAAPAVGSSNFASAGSLRFAQISDVHLFDAGYKCSGLYVQREYEENLNAFRWSIDEVNRRGACQRV